MRDKSMHATFDSFTRLVQEAACETAGAAHVVAGTSLTEGDRTG